MKKISSALIIVVSILCYSSVFAQSMEEIDEMFTKKNNAQAKKIKACDLLAKRSSKAYILKESGMPNDNICSTLIADYKVKPEQCGMIMNVVDEVKKNEGSISENETYEILNEACMRR